MVDQDGKIIDTDPFMKMRMGRIIGVAAGHLNFQRARDPFRDKFYSVSLDCFSVFGKTDGYDPNKWTRCILYPAFKMKGLVAVKIKIFGKPIKPVSEKKRLPPLRIRGVSAKDLAIDRMMLTWISSSGVMRWRRPNKM